jgi:hypothetical protein
LEQNTDGSKYTMTLRRNDVTVEQFEHPNDPNLFRDVYLSPFQSTPHRISEANLGWVNDLFQLIEMECCEKYDSRFEKFVRKWIKEARKDAPTEICAWCCFLLCMLTRRSIRMGK